jgi:hypothetical protein
MKKSYRKPETETVSPRIEGLLYTASPQQGSDDDGTLPIAAKQQTTAPDDDEEDWEDDLEQASLPHFNIWDD